MGLHRVYIAGPLEPGGLSIEGEEAHHAIRVKRLGAGDAIELLDGRGHAGTARVIGTAKVRGEWRLDVDVASVHPRARVAPRIDVLSPAPRGGRVTDLIDGLSQAGAASWSPLATEFSSPEPRETKLERLHRAAAEASKQCGRAWLLEIGTPATLDEALLPARSGRALVIADASGDPYEPSGAESITLLLGPEGGFSPREMARFRDCAARPACFGPHIMRIETAAVVAAAIVLDAEGRSQTRRR